MKVPETASYQQLLDVIEDRLWEDEQTPEDFGYLVDLVNDLYMKTIETEISTLNGCVGQGH